MNHQNHFDLTIVAMKSARKLGERSTGSVGYHVLVDGDRTQVYLAITANEGGGYFSREPVAVAAIYDCVKATSSHESFLVRILRPAFAGRSSNNPGFLGAALRHEGLIVPSDRPNRYIEAGDWNAWAEQYLAAGPLDRQDASSSEAPPKHAEKTGKAGKAGTAAKAERSLRSTEAGGGDVDTNS